MILHYFPLTVGGEKSLNWLPADKSSSRTSRLLMENLFLIILYRPLFVRTMGTISRASFHSSCYCQFSYIYLPLSFILITVHYLNTHK